jgi:hypothetical protein
MLVCANHQYSQTFGHRQTRACTRAQVSLTQEISHHILKRTTISELQVTTIHLLIM